MFVLAHSRDDHRAEREREKKKHQIYGNLTTRLLEMHFETGRAIYLWGLIPETFGHSLFILETPIPSEKPSC